jgi:hypothetical protein
MSASPSLSRIPFRVEDELMIASMALWMRFIGIVTIIGGLLLLFVTALLISMASVLPYLQDTELRQFQNHLANAGVPLVGLSLVLFALSVLTVWAGWVLHQAGENFKLVASTDVADQLYLSRGLDQLRLFFKLEVIKAGLGIILAALMVAVFVVLRSGS